MYLQVLKNKDAEGYEFTYKLIGQMSNVVMREYPRVGERNVFGSVKSRAENGELLNVICQHGGSMWLCESCARRIQEQVEFTLNAESGIDRHFREEESR